MSGDPYSMDDLFEGENDQAFLASQSKQVSAPTEYRELEPQDLPLTVAALDPKDSESVEERIVREKERDRKKPDIDDTRYIKKEIEEAKKEIEKTQYKYKNISPRCLRSYVYLYQEHALQGKCPGLRCEHDPDLLLIPSIENDGEREIVVLRSPVVGSLERHQLFPDSDMVKTLTDYYSQQDK